jgi:integrase/recombinase XerD
MKQIKIDPVNIEGKPRIKLIFDYDTEINNLIRTIPGAYWSSTLKCWNISAVFGPAEKLNYRFMGELQFVPVISAVNKSQLNANTQFKDDSIAFTSIHGKRLDEYTKTLKIKSYSPKTIKTYYSLFRIFLKYFNGKEIDSLTGEEIRDYLLYLIEKRHMSRSFENQTINSIKFYYEKILGRPPEPYYIQRPKSERKLPVVLSEEEVIMILKQIDNLKHKCIIYIIYSAGLRLSEVVNLQVNDIDSKRRVITIRHGKGAKDRFTLLSEKVLQMLREYYREYHPKEWLFEGISGGQYSMRSVQEILKKALSKTNIRKHVSIHTLRHSFATHLLEHGIDLTYIQDFLGHTNPKTTQIYTHITQKGIDNIKSPLDNLDL